MGAKPKRKKRKEEDWIYDSVVMKGILRAKKELDEALKRGDYMPTLEEVIQEFQEEDAKKNTRLDLILEEKEI